MPETALTIARQFGVKLLADTDDYRHRILINSESSTRQYIVSWRISTGEWCCGCRGWLNPRHCKHLTAMMQELRTLDAPQRGAPTTTASPSSRPSRKPILVEESLPAIDVVHQIPRQPQSQAALNSQLKSLQEAAQRLGLYDAADFIRITLDRR